ncbi:hypothetical protein [Kocuria salina]|nr:hypothetical protein [Kocuria salina]
MIAAPTPSSTVPGTASGPPSCTASGTASDTVPGRTGAGRG